MYDLIALDRPKGALLRFEELMTALRPCAPDSTPRMHSRPWMTPRSWFSPPIPGRPWECIHARHFARADPAGDRRGRGTSGVSLAR